MALVGHVTAHTQDRHHQSIAAFSPTEFPHIHLLHQDLQQADPQRQYSPETRSSRSGVFGQGVAQALDRGWESSFQRYSSYQRAVGPGEAASPTGTRHDWSTHQLLFIRHPSLSQLSACHRAPVDCNISEG